MKMKFGAIVVDGRGKIGGHVASKNRAGAYLRTKVTPVNPQSSKQINVRGTFAGLSQAWRGLTVAQRASWNSSVASFAKTDIFGDLKNPSGFNLYQKLNNNLIQSGATKLDVCPLPLSVGSCIATSLGATTTPESLSIVIEPAVPAETALLIDATPQLSAGISFVKNRYRRIAISATGQTSPINILSSYQNAIGSVTEVGSIIYVKITPVSTLTGQVGASSVVSCIVEAS